MRQAARFFVGEEIYYTGGIASRQPIKDSNVCKSLSIEEKSCAKATGEKSEKKIKHVTAAVKRVEYFL
jgi:hypothetical protein